MASELRDCEKKIHEWLSVNPASSIQVIEKGELNPRIDQYRLNEKRNCGIEIAGAFLTISMFKPSAATETKLETVKFETIVLNGNDPTFSQGRVKAQVSCKMTENHIEYITRVPVLTDGIKSPFAVEKLTLDKDDKTLKVGLRATVTPIQKVFRSITDCTYGEE